MTPGADTLSAAMWRGLQGAGARGLVRGVRAEGPAAGDRRRFGHRRTQRRRSASRWEAEFKTPAR
jgi:hypothetical protein